ncbi:MAG: FtsX-like permease family protein [Terracidiphilus sp.]|jgi:putative ABC transport system permease protein
MATQLSFTGFAWRNLWRRPLRTLLTLGGITTGIGAFVALVGFSRGFERDSVRLYTNAGTDIAVIHATLIGGLLDQSLESKIEAVPEVEQAAPVIYNIVDLTSDVSALVYGWRADSYELDTLTYVSGGRIHNGKREVMLGDLLADDLKKRTGDTLPIQGAVFTVVGIFHAGTVIEDGAMIMPLDQMQVIADMDGKVSTFHVKLRPAPPGESYDTYVKHAVKEIEAAAPSVHADPAAERAGNNIFISLARSVAWGTSTIAILIGIIGIANTMAMSVFERTREIGVLRALGWKGGHVILLILTEAAALGLTGGLLGIGVGCATLRLLAALPQSASVVSAFVSPLHLLIALLIAIASGVAAGAYPAWRGAHLSPVDALRYE